MLFCVLCAGMGIPSKQVSAQTSDSALPDAPSETLFHPPHGGNPASDREVSWRSLPKDFLHDQKQIWLFPLQLAKGKHLVPTLVIAGGTAILIATDSHSTPYFGKHQGQLDDINDVFNAYITTGEVIAVPASLMLAGYLRHDDYQVQTAILAGEAYADSAIVDSRRMADIELGGSIYATSTLALQIGLRAQSYTTTLARQRWLSVRVGGEYGPEIFDGVARAVLRAGLIPVANVSGLPSPTFAVLASTGFQVLRGPLTGGLFFSIERYDFPSSNGAPRAEQLEMLTAQVGVRFPR